MALYTSQPTSWKGKDLPNILSRLFAVENGHTLAVAKQYGAFGGATDKTMTITKSLASALAPTLRGLEAGDWLNFNVRYGSSSEYTHVTLRAKYGDLTANPAAAWELWVNGKKQ